MFTGIVREQGVVESASGGPGGLRLHLRAPGTAAGVATGDSVALDGVCLTVTSATDGVLAFDVVPETLSRTTLGGLRAGDRVNVEPAVRAGEPLGGHIVQGHVDGVGSVRAVEPEGDGVRMEVDLPPGLARYCVEKGSITIQGVSLTVAALTPAGLCVALVPHTLEATNLGVATPGSQVNLEVDVIAKHVERLLSPGHPG